MDQGPMGGTVLGAGPPSDFSERLVDGFFRRWVLYLLPVAMFMAIGFSAAGAITADYASYATLSAASNPYLAQPVIRGTEISPYESPAAGTARLINEQLRTDAFIDDVAARAGLTEFIEAGGITRLDLRTRVGVGGVGQSTLQVSSRWADPDTAHRLVVGTIEGYIDYLEALAAADSLTAVEFWTEQLGTAAEEVQAAEVALDTYLAQLPAVPEDQDRPTEQILAIQRLNASLDRALGAESDAQNAIDEAQLTARQAASESTREFTVIDAPEVSTAPESVRRDKITTMAMFTLLGVIIGFAALVLSTVADRAVRTRSQLAHVAGIDSVVVVPRIKQLRRAARRSVSASDEAA